MCSRGLVVLMVVVAGAGQVAAHPRVDHALRDVRLACRGGPRPRFVLRGRWAVTALPHPERGGATVRLDGSTQDWIVALPEQVWQSGRRGPRHHGGATDVTRAIALRRRGRDGRLVLRGAGDAVCRPAGVGTEVTLRIGDERWCARIPGEAIVSRGRRRRARVTETVGPCRCDRDPSGGTWALVQSRLFARHACGQLGCHGPAPAAAGLTLVGADAWELLVGVPSEADGTVARVAPGQSENSMLWRKMAARTLGLPGVPGTPMPIGEPVPDVDELAGLAAWIDAGAPRDGHVESADVLLSGCALAAEDGP